VQDGESAALMAPRAFLDIETAFAPTHGGHVLIPGKSKKHDL
jgi:hypothetical protein